MNASELYKAGRLREAIEAQLPEVKAHPADPARRMFLAELLAFTGDLERTRRQFAAIRFDDLEKDNVVANYLKVLDAEEARRRVFTGSERPQFFIEPPPHIEPRLSALALLHQGKSAEAKAQLDLANAACPAVRGVLNGKPFETLRDEDELFGTVLEVLALGNYYWLPLEQADAVAINPPKAVRDLLWTPAYLQVRGGPEGHAYLPALYPGTHTHADDAVRLGRLTEWTAAEGGPALGVGMHSLLAGGEPIGLLEWRQLTIG